MTHQEIMAIHERTEGWAAGLQLIAFALEQGAEPKRFALDDAPAEALCPTISCGRCSSDRKNACRTS
jgi:hypothetical protein